MDKALGYGPRDSGFKSLAPYRGLVVMVRRLVWDQEAASSILAAPTDGTKEQDDETIQRTLSGFHGVTTIRGNAPKVGHRTVNPSR